MAVGVFLTVLFGLIQSVTGILQVIKASSWGTGVGPPTVPWVYLLFFGAYPTLLVRLLEFPPELTDRQGNGRLFDERPLASIAGLELLTIALKRVPGLYSLHKIYNEVTYLLLNGRLEVEMASPLFRRRSARRPVWSPCSSLVQTQAIHRYPLANGTPLSNQVSFFPGFTAAKAVTKLLRGFVRVASPDWSFIDLSSR